jgi:hypothetical protein
MRIGPGGFEDLSVADTSAYRTIKANGSLDYRDGVWRHIVMVLKELNSSTSQLLVYLDGCLVTTTNMSPKLTIRYDTDMVSQIGAIHSIQFWKGQLDDFRFYNRDLSATDVAQLYQQEAGNLDSDGDGLTDAWERGDGRYQIISGNFTWDQAKADAEARGGHLATFTSSSEWNQFLSIYGLGLTMDLRIGWEADTDSLDNWHWVTGELGSFANWDAGQPDRPRGNGEDSVVLYGRGASKIWHDYYKWVTNFGYLLEYGYPTDPTKADTDGDRFDDKVESLAGTDPNDRNVYPGHGPLDPNGDEDGDGLGNGQELTLGTDPYKKDTDADGVNDPVEIADGTNPNDASSFNSLNKGLVAYYPFNGNAKDESGNGNHGTVIGGTTLATDRFGQSNRAYLFDGSSGYIDAGNPAGNNPVEITQVAWFKIISRNTGIDYDTLITKRHQNDGADWPSLLVGSIYSANQPVFMLDDAGYNRLATAPQEVEPGTWAFICGVKSGQSYKLYVNGVLQDSFSDAHVTGGSPYNMHFMHHGAWHDRYTHGLLDDVRIYNRALSAQEVAQLAGQYQPNFTQTGSMSTPRYYHTATRLNDGRVLVVGGYDAEGRTLASAEIYNPSTGTWSNTGGLHYARTDHQAVLLNSGKVLVFGGFNILTEQCLSTAELYDPSTGVWATTGPMTFGRRLFASTKLADGKVLAVGGYLGNQNLSSAEKYDPASGAWSPAGNMLTPRRNHTATTLNDGKVLVVGGGTGSDSTGFQSFSSSEIYNPLNNQWSQTGSLTTHRGGHTATLLPDGRVLVAAGGQNNSSNFLSSAEVYDSGQGVWSPAGSIAVTRQEHAATLLADGRVLVTGGHGWDGTTATAGIFSSSSGSWDTVPSMLQPRGLHTGTLLNNQQVLVVGGRQGNSGPCLATAELYGIAGEPAGIAPQITSSNSFNGTVGVAFSNTVTASGTAPITFTGSNLPTGLNISTNGVISGTPTIAGTNSAVFTASNSFGVASQTNTFVIAPSIQPTTLSLRVRARIDGPSQLILSPEGIRWYHWDWTAVPGRHEGRNDPTYLNDVAWYPDWPQFGENRNIQAYSSYNTDFNLAEFLNGSAVQLQINRARDSVIVTQEPSSGSTVLTILHYDDLWPGGSDDYDVTISLSTQDTQVPVITLIGSNPLEVYKGSAFTDPGAMVSDNVDAVRTITGSGTVNTATVGIYTLTYTATDAAGNLGLPVTRTVNVVLDPAADEDGDGISNGGEISGGTNPYQRDSDGDGVNDPVEIADGTNPNDATSYNSLNKGLVAYYPMNGNANDASGNGNQGNLHGPATTLDRHGVASAAYRFSDSSYIQIPNSASMSLGFLDLSVSVWVNTTATGSRSIYSDDSDDYRPGFELALVDSKALYEFSPTSSGNFIRNGSISINDGKWHQVLLTFERGGKTRIYIDGILDADHSSDPTLQSISNSVDSRIGQSPNGGSSFNGIIDDVRIYNRALSAAEVGQLYQTEAGNLDSDADGLTDAWERGYGRYQIVIGSFTWDQAKTNAEAKGGHLATFTSAGEWNWFLSNWGSAITNNLRFGLEAGSGVNTWIWTTGEVYNFTAWDVDWGQPERPLSGEDSAAIYATRSNLWHDYHKSYGEYGYVLEFGYPTDPTKADTDGDGFNDKVESLAGTDPNSATVFPNPDWDFSFGFSNINEAGAETYLAATSGVRKYSEWQNPPTTYWGPTSNGIDASLTYRVTGLKKIRAARLKTGTDTYNFPWPGYFGSGKGWSSIWGSKDGSSWVQLMDNPMPTDNVGRWMAYDQLLPSNLLGGTELWIQIRLRVTEAPNSSYTTAQFGRGSSANSQRIFEVKLDYDGLIPETSQASVGFAASALPEDPAARYALGLDSDGDGQSDAAELVAGTDPYDAKSLFALTLANGSSVHTQSVTGNGSGTVALTLTWTSVPGKNYVVEASSDLTNWAMVATVSAAAGQNSTSYQVYAGGERAFYRVSVLAE